MELLAVVFPHLAAVRIERVYQVGAIVRVKAATTEPKSLCPGCGCESVRVHSRYERCLADLPVAGQEVLLQVRVRRFFCDNPGCGRKTFAEQGAFPINVDTDFRRQSSGYLSSSRSRSG
ncbi:transposase family protein [Nonomuraea sp. NPDC004297]